jgi:hypothetical protein
MPKHLDVTFENGTRAVMPDRELNLSGGRLPGAGYALDCTRGFPHSLVILTREGRILGWIDIAKIGFPDVGHWLKAGAPGRQGEMASHSASPLRGRVATQLRKLRGQIKKDAREHKRQVGLIGRVLRGHSPRHMGPADKRADLKNAILHARAVIRHAEQSGEPSDFQVAETAFHIAANKAHNLGMELPYKQGEFDRPGSIHSLGTRLNKLSDKSKGRAQRIAGERYQAKHAQWSKRDTLLGSGRPPVAMNVIDQHGGFTIETVGPKSGRNTVWRPATHPLEGKARYAALVSFDPKSFFQTNNDVTKAVYKIKGYRYPVIVWFDNKTGHRIA